MNESGSSNSAGGGIKGSYVPSRSDPSDSSSGKRFKALRDFHIFGGGRAKRSTILPGFLISHLVHCHRLCSASEFSAQICSCSSSEHEPNCHGPRKSGKDTVEGAAGPWLGLEHPDIRKPYFPSEGENCRILVSVEDFDFASTNQTAFTSKLNLTAEPTKLNNRPATNPSLLDNVDDRGDCSAEPGKSDCVGTLTSFWLAASGQSQRPQSSLVGKRLSREDKVAPDSQSFPNDHGIPTVERSPNPGVPPFSAEGDSRTLRGDCCHEEPSKPPTGPATIQSYSETSSLPSGPTDPRISLSTNAEQAPSQTSLHPISNSPVALLQRPQHLGTGVFESSSFGTSRDKDFQKRLSSAMLPMGGGPTLVEPNPPVVPSVGIGGGMVASNGSGRLAYFTQNYSSVEPDLAALGPRTTSHRKSFGRFSRFDTAAATGGHFRNEVLAHLVRCQQGASLPADPWLRSDNFVAGDGRSWNTAQGWGSGTHGTGLLSQQRSIGLGHASVAEPLDVTLSALHSMTTRSAFARHLSSRSGFGTGTPPSGLSNSSSLLRQRLERATEQQLSQSSNSYLPSSRSSMALSSSLGRLSAESAVWQPSTFHRQPTGLLQSWATAPHLRTGPVTNSLLSGQSALSEIHRELLSNGGSSNALVGGGRSGFGLGSLPLAGLSPNHRTDRQGIPTDSPNACIGTSHPGTSIAEDSPLLSDCRSPAGPLRNPGYSSSNHPWLSGVSGTGEPGIDTRRTSHRERRAGRSQIVDVWAENLESEFARIRDIVERYQYIAIDTEFPGIVARPTGVCSDYHYKTIKFNVDLLKVIQLGISFADERGNNPTGTSTWQFNFKFDLNRDMYAQDSIDFLRRSGVDFEVHENHGIDIHEFGELIISSGLVMNRDVKWISFHGSYDFGYLLKLLTCAPLPPTEAEFFDLLRDYFPALYDIKFILQNCPNLNGGISLQKIAEHLDVRRVGRQHQAGSDSLVTCHTFFRLMDIFFDNLIDDSVFSGVIYGLGGAAGLNGTNGTSGRRKSNGLQLGHHQESPTRRAQHPLGEAERLDDSQEVSEKDSGVAGSSSSLLSEERVDVTDEVS